MTTLYDSLPGHRVEENQLRLLTSVCIDVVLRWVSCDYLRQFALTSCWSKLVVTTYDSWLWRRVEGSLVWLLTTVCLIVVFRTVIFAITHQESRNAFGAPVAQVVSLSALTSGTFNDTVSFTKLQFDGFGRLRVYWRNKKASMYSCIFKHKN